MSIDSILEHQGKRIAALTQQLADMTADRDSEHRWAEEYHRKWQAAEGERDYYKGAYERTLKGQREALDSAVALCSQRDSALALARQAVEVLKPFNTEIHESITNNSLLVYLQFAAGGVLSKVTVGQLRRARAFLARPEVVKIGGGE